MNFSLLVIIIIIFITILLLSIIIKKNIYKYKNTKENLENLENLENPENFNFKNTNIKHTKLFASDLSSINELLLPGNIQENTHKNHQKELFSEKTIFLAAPPGEFFMGYALVQALQNANFYYGPKGLFYYNYNDHILCTLSPVTVPPIFDMAEIGVLKVSLLKLVINFGADEQHIQSVIQKLADELEAEIKYEYEIN